MTPDPYYEIREYHGIEFCGPRVQFPTSYTSTRSGSAAKEAMTVLHCSDVRTVFVCGECLFIVDTKDREHHVNVDEKKHRHSAMYAIAEWALRSGADEREETASAV